MRYTLHIYGILLKKGWHYSTSFNSYDNVLLFFDCHKPQYYDKRLVHRLYRVHDNVNDTDDYFIVDYEKLSYKHNHVRHIDIVTACIYILGV